MEWIILKDYIEVRRDVCGSDRLTGCKYKVKISVKKLWILLYLQTV